jgi:hypothetical protein
MLFWIDLHCGVCRCSENRSCRCLIRSAAYLAPVYFVLLQVNPEEHGVTYKVLDRDSHGLQFRKREVFGVLPLPLHPVQ